MALMLAPRTRMVLVWLVAVVIGALFFVIASGIFTDFYHLRLGLLFCFFVLAALAFLMGYRRFGVAGIALGLLFNPIVPLHIPRYIWTIIDTVSFAGVVYFAYWATNSYKKGTRFEQYVSNLFPEPDFVVVDRTRDISKFLDRRVESDMHPDFVFRNQKTGETFAVECKWRGRWKRHKNLGFGLWWKTWQGERYRVFGQERGMPVYVAFGVGGSPEKPEEVYFLKIEDLVYPFLKQSLVRNGKMPEQMRQFLLR